MAIIAPKGTITINSMKRLLSGEGCTLTEIGECFQALDEETVGCVHIQVLLTKGAEAITTHTKLSKEQAQDLVDVYVSSRPSVFSSRPTRSI
jgi:hypothetical protein